MNKTEFLLALQRQISLLEDDEQTDIIDEYSQHIDMKIESGMTEAEAIEDFGPLDQLVSEILSAYHVKAPASVTANTAVPQPAIPIPMPAPDPASQANAGNAKVIEAEKVLEGGKRAAANAAASVAAATKKGASALKHVVSDATAKTKDAAGIAGEKTKESSKSFFGKARQGAGSMATGIAKGSGMLGSGLASAVVTCIRWCWNICVACMCAFFLFCALVCLFTFGFCIVLTIQGYPLIGVSLCALGLLMASLSLGLLTVKLIRRKPKNMHVEQAAPGTYATFPSGVSPAKAPGNSPLTTPNTSPAAAPAPSPVAAPNVAQMPKPNEPTEPLAQIR